MVLAVLFLMATVQRITTLERVPAGTRSAMKRSAKVTVLKHAQSDGLFKCTGQHCEAIFLSGLAIAAVLRTKFPILPLVTLAAFGLLRPTSTQAYLVKRSVLGVQ